MSRTSANSESRKGVKSVETAARILQTLAKLISYAPLKDIAAGTKIDSSRTYTYLVSLVRSGLVEQNQDTGMYRLGPEVRNLGLAALKSQDIHETISNAAVELRDKIGDTVYVAMWSIAGPVVVNWERGNRSLPVNINVGSIMPLLGTAMGQVFLAYMPKKDTRKEVKKELERLRLHKSHLRLRTEKDVQDLTQMIMSDGLARFTGALIPDLSAIAAPVLARDGKIVAVIGVIGPDICTGSQIAKTAEKTLLSTTLKASNNLGYSA
jgi:DNA-binding IclR family transcriptional regulator